MYQDDFSFLELPDEVVREVQLRMRMIYLKSYVEAKGRLASGQPLNMIRPNVAKGHLTGALDGLALDHPMARSIKDGIDDALEGREMNREWQMSPDEVHDLAVEAVREYEDQIDVD